MVDLVQIFRHYFGYFIYLIFSILKKPYIGGYCFVQQEFLRGRFQIIEKEITRYVDNFFPTKNQKIKVLEIGSYAGSSCLKIARVLKEKKVDFEITCCDIWDYQDIIEKDIGKFSQHTSRNSHRSGKIFQIFIENILYSNNFDKVTIIKGDSRKTLLDLIKQKIKYDIIFVDGGHLYNIVNEDLRNVKELIKENGIIFGDDYELPYNKIDAKFLNHSINQNISFKFDKKNNTAYHPGVTKAVYQNFGDLCEKNGLFSVQRIDGKFIDCFKL